MFRADCSSGPAAQRSVPRPHHVRLFFHAAPPLQPGPLRRKGRDLGQSRDLGSPVALTVSPGIRPGHNGYQGGCRRAQFVFLPSQRPRRPPCSPRRGALVLGGHLSSWPGHAPI
ncbi:hypothetical protein NDU88_004942 [Pleurodeles waltl]|uniref:Uncharacterized protein n=1 Tax=Pleurodeles waltl TaxID=8319 RepID=A0AAV7KZD2_PLEWA|nr:hypothetical protein NDU88_004942 [Pleurodeles waltl]